MAHVQAAAAMEAAHEQQLASHSGLLDSALDVTATVEARFGLQTNSVFPHIPPHFPHPSQPVVLLFVLIVLLFVLIVLFIELFILFIMFIVFTE